MKFGTVMSLCTCGGSANLGTFRSESETRRTAPALRTASSSGDERSVMWCRVASMVRSDGQRRPAGRVKGQRRHEWSGWVSSILVHCARALPCLPSFRISFPVAPRSFPEHQLKAVHLPSLDSHKRSFSPASKPT